MAEGADETTGASEEEYKEESIRPWQMRACQFFFLLVFMRMPFFEVPCAKGICTAPLEIVAAELYAYDRAPHTLIKAILYPGALAQMAQATISGDRDASPTWATLLDEYRGVTLKHAWEQPFPRSWDAFRDQQLDLIGGSFIVLFAAVLALFGPGVAGTAGMVLLFMHLMREGLQPHSFMLFAAGCSFSWVPFHTFSEAAPRKRPAAAPARSTAAPPLKLRTRGKFKVY